MNNEELTKLLNAIDNSGIAEGLISELSKQLNVEEKTVKVSLKIFIHIINGLK